MSSVFLFGHSLPLEEYFSCLIAAFALFLILAFGDEGLRRPFRLLLLLFVLGFFLLLCCAFNRAFLIRSLHRLSWHMQLF